MNGVFEFAGVHFNLKNQSNLNVCNCNIPCFGKYGIETAPPVGPKVQDKVPSEIKNSKFPEEFTVQTNVRNKVRIYELGSLL